MANHKSAKKRARQTIKKNQRNKQVKSQVRNALKKAYEALQENGADAAEKVKDAISSLMKATSKGIFHKNTSSRTVSRLKKSSNSVVKTGAASTKKTTKKKVTKKKTTKKKATKKKTTKKKTTKKKKK